MVKKNLNVLERLKIIEIIQGLSGSFADLKIIQDTISKVGFSEEEIKKYQIKTTDLNTAWNSKGKEDVEIEFGERACQIIIDELKKLNEAEKLTQHLFSVYEKFVEVKQDASN